MVSDPSEALLKTAITRLGLSARAYHRILRIARTVADLDASAGIGTAHVTEAVKVPLAGPAAPGLSAAVGVAAPLGGRQNGRRAVDPPPTRPTRPADHMTPDQQRSLIDRYIAAYNAFDVDGMLATVHPEIEFRNVSGGETTASASGAEQFRRMAEQSRTLFSARRQEVTGVRVEGGSVAVDLRYEGVLAADLPNGMRVGETIRLEGRSEFGFRDGRIDRITDYS